MENDTTEGTQESTQVEQEAVATAVEDVKVDRRRGKRETNDPAAPYGWKIDKTTGERIARSAPGRKKKLVQS